MAVRQHSDPRHHVCHHWTLGGGRSVSRAPARSGLHCRAAGDSASRIISSPSARGLLPKTLCVLCVLGVEIVSELAAAPLYLQTLVGVVHDGTNRGRCPALPAEPLIRSRRVFDALRVPGRYAVRQRVKSSPAGRITHYLPLDDRVNNRMYSMKISLPAASPCHWKSPRRL